VKYEFHMHVEVETDMVQQAHSTRRLVTQAVKKCLEGNPNPAGFGVSELAQVIPEADSRIVIPTGGQA